MKSFKTVTVPNENICILIGAPATGKSTFARSIPWARVVDNLGPHQSGLKDTIIKETKALKQSIEAPSVLVFITNDEKTGSQIYSLVLKAIEDYQKKGDR